MHRWFKQNEKFDEDIKKKFKTDYKRLDSGQYTEWGNHHDGRLAMIILCDQLSRSFYRGQKEAF